MGKRELVALLNLSFWCLVMVERLFLAVPRGCLRFVIVVFPDHTHLLFLSRGPSPYDLSCWWDVKHKHDNNNYNMLVYDLCVFLTRAISTREMVLVYRPTSTYFNINWELSSNHLHHENFRNSLKNFRNSLIYTSKVLDISNSYAMGCPPVRGDNSRALASGLSYVQVDKHGKTILYHLHQCRPCTSQDISC